MNFKKILRELRKENDLTQKQLAEKIGVTETSIRDWENKGCQPSYEILCEIAKFFDVTVGQLLGVEDI
ncbi:MAG: helix-turn-helix domain-containing protein [Firmicutes bacterium]|nr:helix-turn-helix domain-containing protein [Bacillota bacterium]